MNYPFDYRYFTRSYLFCLTWISLTLLLITFPILLIYIYDREINLWPLLFLIFLPLILAFYFISVKEIRLEGGNILFIRNRIIKTKVKNLINLILVKEFMTAGYFQFIFKDGSSINILVSAGEARQELSKFIEKLAEIKKLILNDPKEDIKYSQKF